MEVQLGLTLATKVLKLRLRFASGNS